jgi:hypothetical protein
MGAPLRDELGRGEYGEAGGFVTNCMVRSVPQLRQSQNKYLQTLQQIQYQSIIFDYATALADKDYGTQM